MDRLKLIKERHAARKITEEFVDHMAEVNLGTHTDPSFGITAVFGQRYDRMTDHDIRHELGHNFSTIENQD